MVSLFSNSTAAILETLIEVWQMHNDKLNRRTPTVFNIWLAEETVKAWPVLRGPGAGKGLLMENWETKLPQEQQTKRLHSHRPHSHWDANSRCPGPHRKANLSSLSPESDGSCSDRTTPQLDKAKGGRIREPFSGEGKTQKASQNMLAHLVEGQQWKGIGHHHNHSLKEPESYTFKEVNLKKKSAFW